GRNAGTVWFWFIDVFAVACVIFAVTGLGLMWLHARGRPSTWPLAALGLREGDVILSVGGEPLTSEERVAELSDLLGSGRAVEVRWRRGGQVLTATLAPTTE
ncbi:PepSY-associated TM helix domain-containing protein, partial [Klebsiella pneumoniae]|uniref:PepSY-associated TM helix domain-containing protein n=1 Tax=Klebsiella pneumoniae TaxID=573 RepID=UPI00210B262C